jgi:hypothetical protein
MPIAPRAFLVALCLLACGCGVERGGAPGSGGAASFLAAGVDFERVAAAALQAMSDHATALKANGAAMVACIPGDATASWSSRMQVVGTFMIKGQDNVLAIVYTKAAEMADTLKDSGSGVRPKKNGENGWPGGVIRKVPGGYVLAAFSGARSEDDVAISRQGLEVLARAYDPQPAGK